MTEFDGAFKFKFDTIDEIRQTAKAILEHIEKVRQVTREYNAVQELLEVNKQKGRALKEEAQQLIYEIDTAMHELFDFYKSCIDCDSPVSGDKIIELLAIMSMKNHILKTKTDALKELKDERDKLIQKRSELKDQLDKLADEFFSILLVSPDDSDSSIGIDLLKISA